MASRPKTSIFQINGKDMIVPDEEPNFSYEDIDAADAGRDETGHMHRSVVFYKCGKWPFSYSKLTNEEYVYMEGLFGDAPSFQFTRPSRTNPAVSETTECYRSKFNMVYKNAKKGIWNNYKFNIIEM